MISDKIEAVLKTWSDQVRTGNFTRASLTIGSNQLQDCAAQVRAMEEGGGPLGYDASEADLETLTHHFADLIDPSAANARLRD